MGQKAIDSHLEQLEASTETLQTLETLAAYLPDIKTLALYLNEFSRTLVRVVETTYQHRQRISRINRILWWIIGLQLGTLLIALSR